MCETSTKATLTALLGLCAIPMMASLAVALDPLIYDNGVVPNTGLSSQLDTSYPFESQVADDFVLPTENGSDWDVTGITFTQLQFGTPDPLPHLPNPTTYNVYFYADNGSGTDPLYTGDGNTSPAADAIGSVSVLLTAPEGPPGPYSYELEFPAVAFSGNTTYWVAVQAEFAFPPQAGWRAETSAAGNSVQGFPLIGTPFWSVFVEQGGTDRAEMDFQLYGTQNPEPASGLMLLIGIVGLGFCRRR